MTATAPRTRDLQIYLGLLAVLGVAFGALTFVTGDYVAPASEREAVLLKARFSGGIALGGAGRGAPQIRCGRNPLCNKNVQRRYCGGAGLITFFMEGHCGTDYLVFRCQEKTHNPSNS